MEIERRASPPSRGKVRVQEKRNPVFRPKMTNAKMPERFLFPVSVKPL
jgi:hypothetical protein